MPVERGAGLRLAAGFPASRHNAGTPDIHIVVCDPPMVLGVGAGMRGRTSCRGILMQKQVGGMLRGGRALAPAGGVRWKPVSRRKPGVWRARDEMNLL